MLAGTRAATRLSFAHLPIIVCQGVGVNFYRPGSLKAWFVPGGVLLLVAALVLQTGLVPLSAQAVDFYYYAVFSAGALLAWRFHPSRVILVLLTLLLAHRAIDFFSAGRILAAGPGRIAFETVAFLLPLNFLVFSLIAERGFVLPATFPRLALLFLESVLVAVLCRPGELQSPSILRFHFLNAYWFSWTKIPQLPLFAFVLCFAVLLVRFLLRHKPVDNGLLWSLAATLLGLQAGAISQIGSAYFATAGLILVASLVENSYFLAYHDELTSLPARRAFNDALLALELPYVVAAVDIDHFKNVNDTYGHDAGDQVLSMVAARLARIDSGGQAYRVGGEEFTVLFPGKTIKDVLPALEALRLAIAETSFRVRSTTDRRKVPRGPDRRGQKQRNAKSAERQKSGQLSVTISIGVAEPGGKTGRIEDVIQAADKALYRAKRGGRNRIETAGSSRSLTRGAAQG